LKQNLRVLLPGLRDLHIYIGGALVAVGAWMVFPPAAPAVFGAVLIFRGVWRMS
jgi:hypothetical protein